MKNKTKWLSLLAAAVVLLGGCKAGLVNDDSDDRVVVNEETAELIKGQAGLVLDNGEKVASFSAGISEDESVLQLLTEVLDKEGIEYELESFDFGDLVVSIDGEKNSADKAWIYYVNGTAGDVGAGEKLVKAGDLVEWKFIKPIY